MAIFGFNFEPVFKPENKVLIVASESNKDDADYKEFYKQIMLMINRFIDVKFSFFDDDYNIGSDKATLYIENGVDSGTFDMVIIYLSDKIDVLIYNKLINYVKLHKNILIYFNNEKISNYYKDIHNLFYSSSIVELYDEYIHDNIDILDKKIKSLLAYKETNKFVAIVTDDEQHAAKLLNSIRDKYLEKYCNTSELKVVTSVLQGYTITENCLIRDRLLVYINKNVYGRTVKKIKNNKSMIDDRYARIRKIVTVKIDEYNTISYCYIHPSTITDFSYVEKLFDKIYVDVMSNYKELKLPKKQLVEDESIATPYIRENIYQQYTAIQSHIDLLIDGNKSAVNAYNKFKNTWLNIQKNMMEYFFIDTLTFKIIYEGISFTDMKIEQYLLYDPIVADIDKKRLS